MGKPFKLELIADVRDVIRGTRDMSSALDGAARDLDDLARESQTAGRDMAQGLDRGSDALDDVGRDAGRAGDRIEREFGAAMRDAARATKTAAKAAGDSIPQGMTPGVNKAKAKLAEIGEEAQDTVRESAASFSSLGGSITDVGQELATNAGALFGPWGLAIGGALSAGIALFAQRLEEIREKATDILADFRDSGGVVTSDIVKTRLSDLGVGITDLARTAKNARVPVDDFLLAVAGDPAAIDRTTQALDAQWQAFLKSNEVVLDDGRDAYLAFQKYQADAKNALGEQTEATKLATAAYEAYATAAANASTNLDASAVASRERGRATEELGATLDRFADPADAYSQLLTELGKAEQERAAAVAASTADATDSWEDHAKAVDVSVLAITERLEAQVRDQEAWQANMTRLAARVSSTTLAELAKLGPQGAPLVAKLVTASEAEVSRMDAAFRRASTTAVTGAAAAITAATPKVATAGTGLADAAIAAYRRAERTLSDPITVPIDADTRAFDREIARVRAENKRAAMDRGVL